MSYIGNTPGDKYLTLEKQTFTTSATDTYTLDREVSGVNDIELFLNNVRQEPTEAYTISGTTLTLASAITASDSMYCIYQGRSVGTQAPATGSVTGAMMSYPLTNFSSTGIDDNATSTAITVDSSQNVSISNDLTVDTNTLYVDSTNNRVGIGTSSPTDKLNIHAPNSQLRLTDTDDSTYVQFSQSAGKLVIRQNTLLTDHLTIKSDRVLVGSSNDLSTTTTGCQMETAGTAKFARSGFFSLVLNRTSNDGEVAIFEQDGTQEGGISISGTTTSYNGFTGTHWSRLSDNSKPTILKGTILESLDEMMDWYQVQFDIIETDNDGNEITRTQKESYALADGENVGDIITYNFDDKDYQATIIQEGDIKHTKSKISDTVDAKNVYGVFMAWDNDDDKVNDMYVAQTGTFVIRMNSAETVSKGDLIQSNGDGTGKVQADDIIRSSTVAKVLSTTKIETYEDGSYIVPCSLHC